MRLRNVIESISRKILLIILALIIVAVSLYLVWQNHKYRFVRDKVKSTVAEQTDSLYKIKYDSLYFDEIAGEAYLKNIHIGLDTTIIKRTKLDDLPYILLDITISNLKVSGVKTDKALLGKQMDGDSVIIDHPDVTVYFIKPLQKKTNINEEARSVYNEILGNLKRIQVGHIFINDVHIQGVDYFLKTKVFDLTNGNIQLTDVLVDSAHNLDTTRTLFCKQIAMQLASFIEFDNSRPEISVKNLNFSGADNLLSFGDIDVNRFESSNGDSIKLLRAINLDFKGIDANEFVKNKNIIIDTIQCNAITIYQPPLKKLKLPGNKSQKKADTAGFRHVYSIEMKHLGFPKITFIPREKSGISIGNITVAINEVRANAVIDVQRNPLDYSKEVEISCDKISMKSKDGFYEYVFNNSSINSLHKQLKIASVNIKPFLSEKAFANKAHFQKDRYDVALKNIFLKNIDMKNLLDKKIYASDLLIDNVSAKIYRDISKPESGKNKIGNYPSQMLMKMNVPVNISHATLSNAFLQYKEHEKISDSTGVVTFNGTTVNISNITNIKDAIEKNNVTTVLYKTKILNEIQAAGSFKFLLNSNIGGFSATGHVLPFDAVKLNRVSVPMALLRLHTGKIDAVDFNFTGNDTIARGDFTMKYRKLKVDLLKRDKDSKEIKKKGITSLVANIIVKNNNPVNGNLRKETPHYDRDVHKSFFNLVWKTIFTGMKKTLGLP